MQRVSWFCASLLVLAGCSSTPSGYDPMAEPAMTSAEVSPIMTPAQTVGGRVSLANMRGHYVVLTYPIGTLPGTNKQLSLFRDGLKVGEVRVTGPQRDNSTVADILSGDARVGDEVR